MQKHSKQRDAIIEELLKRVDHPTADEVYSALKEKMPNLSLGTVYRNLNLLSNDGTILKLSCDGADRFDGNCNVHYHLFCRECTRVYDLDLPVMENLNQTAQEYYGGKIESHELMFLGICKNCSDKNE